jgi:hypothetical protein
MLCGLDHQRTLKRLSEILSEDFSAFLRTHRQTASIVGHGRQAGLRIRWLRESGNLNRGAHYIHARAAGQ